MKERPIRILLIDDEELVRTAVRIWLEDEQFQIDEAISGADALDRLATESFDCGILDLQLSDMSGVEVIKTAQYVDKSPDWLVMSGNLDAVTYEELRELGIADDSILQKPIFDMRIISTRIQKSVAR